MVNNELVEFYEKRAKAFLDYHKQINKNTLCKFFDIKDGMYYKIMRNIRERDKLKFT